MIYDEMRAILDDIEYIGWSFDIKGPLDKPYLQVSFLDYNGEKQRGRKWMLSFHMTKSELVQTAFLAVKTAEEHEIRERFRYKGRLIYSPHFNVDSLALLAVKENLDMRTGAWVA